jgi:heme exporter protein A
MRLTAENLSGERGGEAVFSGIGFSLERGDGLVVTGPNGSGKSTLLRVIAGLLPASEGRVAIEGGGETFPTVASACHYLGHQNAMKPALTVAENLAFWRNFLGPAKTRASTKRDFGQVPAVQPEMAVDEALGTVGLGGIGHLPYGYLSTGQRRRAAIARLLVSYRPVWLLDEATVGLDKASEEQFSALVKRLLVAGGVVIAATHLPLGIEGRELRMAPGLPSPLRGGSRSNLLGHERVETRGGGGEE